MATTATAVALRAPCHVQNGQSVPLRVTTYKGQAPIWQYAPQGLQALNLANRVQMNQDPNSAGLGGEFVEFRRRKLA